MIDVEAVPLDPVKLMWPELSLTRPAPGEPLLLMPLPVPRVTVPELCHTSELLSSTCDPLSARTEPDVISSAPDSCAPLARSTAPVTVSVAGPAIVPDIFKAARVDGLDVVSIDRFPDTVNVGTSDPVTGQFSTPVVSPSLTVTLDRTGVLDIQVTSLAPGVFPALGPLLVSDQFDGTDQSPEATPVQ